VSLTGAISETRFPKRKQLEIFMLVIICAGSLLNASRVYELNARGKQDFEVWGQYIRQVEGFVQAHKHEPDFSFAIDDQGALETPIAIRIGEPSENREIRGYPTEFLFRKYFNKENPKYRFSFKAGAR
jgi:hypothetical protein